MALRLMAATFLASLCLIRFGGVEAVSLEQFRDEIPSEGMARLASLAVSEAAPAAAEAGTAIGSHQPVAFVENLGQWDGDFTHKARMGPMTVFLQERGLTFTLEERSRQPEPDHFNLRANQPEPASASACGVAVRMHFEGGAGPALPIEEQRLPGVHNYFLGNEPERWRSSVPLHGAVLLSGLYPGIDLRARSQDDHFEYDLLIEPGADLEQVVVTLEGADGIRLDTDGTLIIDTALGPVRQTIPRTWQVDAFGEHQEVSCRYVLREEHGFGFDVAERDSALALVVDPGLVYSTFLGGSWSDSADRLAVDATGAVTVAGRTNSPSFPITPGAFSTTYHGGTDLFVTRLDPSGSALVFSTFIGGSGNELIGALALDAAGATTVAGWTSNPGNFPTTPGAFSTTYNGGTWDGFVTRLSSSGSTLIYSTFLGGSSDDFPKSLVIETNGVVAVAGGTTSSDFPTTSGAFDTTHNGWFDAFMTRIDPSGSALVYSTFVGGSSHDRVEAIAVDATGATTVVGGTLSSDFPTTPGAFDTTYNGGPLPSSDGDAFVSRFNAAGSSLIYSTFLGGSGEDVAYALFQHNTGAATVAGTTSSTNFPTTSGAFDASHNGGKDAFVARLDASGGLLVYSTFVGGSADEWARGLALDSTGAATVAGNTGSFDFPVTPGALGTTFVGGGFSDGFVSRLNPSGNALSYSTLFGGSGVEGVSALALDSSGTATVAGNTASSDFPVTAGAFDTTFNGAIAGGYDAFVTRLDLGTTIGLSQPGGPGTPITIDNGYLIPGNEYHNIFSVDLCPAGPGTGPYLGLCATTLANVQFIVLQASLPVGSPPFHFVATAPTASWGPYTVGPGTLDALCLDVTGGVLGSYSPVTRITIQ